MNEITRTVPPNPIRGEDELETVAVTTVNPDLEDTRLVLALLEADQVVAAKRRTHFGQRKFSLGVRVLLWGLRVYVVMMLVIVVISVLRAMHAVH